MEAERTIMGRLKEWLYNEFLPKETKEIYLKERKVYKSQIEYQSQKINELQAYIDGVHDVIRQRMKITINNEVSK